MNQSLRRTPLYPNHLSLGAKMVPFAGWEMPVSYPVGIIAEHLAVRNSLGIFDIGHMGVIKIEGAGALSLIQKVATNDASKLVASQCQYSILCNEAGGTIDDILVYRLPEYYILIANASNADKVLSWLNQFSNGKKINFYENHCMLSIQGPKAFSAVAAILNAPLSELKHNHIMAKDGILFSRTGYTGEDGIELILPVDKVTAVWEKFIQQGIQPCGLGARDTLRLEAGLPLYGHEYDDETTPLEAGYGWAVKFDKGNFMGREALLKEKISGPKKQLCGIEIVEKMIPRQGNLVFSADGKTPIGKITSGTFSPSFKKPIALAYLSSLESQAQVEIRTQKVPARVVDKTFYKRVK